jgi:chromosome segregation ATPase
MKAKVQKLIADKDEAFATQVAALRAELEAAHKEITVKLQQQVESLGKSLHDESTAKAEATGKWKLLESQLSEAMSKLKLVEVQLAEEREMRGTIEQVGAASEREAAEMKDTIEKLKEALSRMQENRSKSAEEEHSQLNNVRAELKVKGRQSPIFRGGVK